VSPGAVRKELIVSGQARDFSVGGRAGIDMRCTMMAESVDKSGSVGASSRDDRMRIDDSDVPASRRREVIR
jgi:hypothetical protein